jgi:hypothetical protein
VVEEDVSHHRGSLDDERVRLAVSIREADRRRNGVKNL